MPREAELDSVDEQRRHGREFTQNSEEETYRSKFAVDRCPNESISEIPAPCQTSKLLWSLTCLLDYSRLCTNSYDLWRCPWIGFMCYDTI